MYYILLFVALSDYALHFRPFGAWVMFQQYSIVGFIINPVGVLFYSIGREAYEIQDIICQPCKGDIIDVVA